MNGDIHVDCARKPSASAVGGIAHLLKNISPPKQGSWTRLTNTYYMTVKRTLKLKLSLPVGDILPTVEEYTRAFNLVAQRAFEDGDFNSISVHHKVYKTLRETLPAQLSVSARMKAMESMLSMRTIKRKKKLPLVQPKSKQSSIRYDRNSMTIFLNRGEVSLLTIDGRTKTTPVLSETSSNKNPYL